MPTCPSIPRIPQEVLMRFRTMRDYDRQMYNYASNLCSVIPDATDVSTILSRLDAIEVTLALYATRLDALENNVSLLQAAEGEGFEWVEVSDPTYTIVDHNIGLLVNTSVGSIAINLPSAADFEGEKIMIKDNSGDAGTNNISIQPNGSDTIDDDIVLVIDSDYAGVQLESNGSGWEIV